MSQPTNQNMDLIHAANFAVINPSGHQKMIVDQTGAVVYLSDQQFEERLKMKAQHAAYLKATDYSKLYPNIINISTQYKDQQ